MNKFRNTKIAKTIAAVAGFTTGVMMVGGVLASSAAAQSVEDLQAQIASLLATISGLQEQLTTMTGGTTAPSSCSSYTFSTDLSMGDTGTDVMNLQKVLNMDADTQVAASGVGSAGNETEYFGGLTKSAVIKFQNKYASEVLAPIGLTAGTGYVGSMSRAKLNTMATCEVADDTADDVVADDTSDDVVVTDGTLMVSSAVQPANSLAIQGAARVPFTKVTFTAGTADVTVDSITVERVGLSSDSNFAGVVVLDENGTQLGIAKTLNSNHQAVLTEDFVVAKGTSRTMTIAGNMAANLATTAGEVVGLSVVAVNANASLSGLLPVNGAMHTTNGTLSLGTVTMDRGTMDPNTTATKEVGTTNYIFSSVKATAGSAEQVRLNSIRFNQSGSASKDDITNVVISVDGTTYTPVVSADGKYYTVVFGSGIVIDKGLSKEITLKGDIASGSGRTIDFDIYKMTDINVSGETYGYGLTPAAGTGFSTTVTPAYNASVVTVSGGAIAVQKANSVASQNIAVNVPNEVLGAVLVDVKGEAVTVQSILFTAASSTGLGTLSQVTLVDANGATVAGPIDPTGLQTSFTFTDNVTFPVGENVYVVKGKLSTATPNNKTWTLTTNPATGWTSVTGENTGNTITPTPSSALALQTVTAKAATVAVTVSATPAAQNVVAGAQGFVFANYQFDGTASGEDVRFNSLALQYTHSNADGSLLTSCKVMDGSTVLNASNPVNPLAAHVSGADVTITLDSGGLVVPKGTVKTVSVACNISSAATGTFNLGLQTLPVGTGLTSGTSATVTKTNAVGQTMTVTSAGTLTVSKDSSSPSYAIAAAGGTDVTLGVLKFEATNEEITLNKLSLQLTNTASSSASDLVKVTLWDGTTKVGEALFAGSATTTNVSLYGSFVIPKDGTKLMTVKADLSEIGTGKAGTQGALVAVDYDGDDAANTQGSGAASGATVASASATDTAFDGVRVFRSFPVLAKDTVSTNTLNNGTMSLLRFKVTADAAGDVGLDEFELSIATSGTALTVSGVNVYAYTNSSYSSAVAGVSAGGKLSAADQSAATGVVTIDIQTSGAADTALQIPAGATRYFDVRGTVASAAAGDSVSTQLVGDPAFTAHGALMGTALQVDGDVNDSFIWSPNATGTSALTTNDWTNGYGLTGLPGTGMSAEVVSK
jgi:hypothetical protein